MLQGEKYVVNGSKLWTSRAEHSDLMILLARTAPDGEVTCRRGRRLGQKARYTPDTHPSLAACICRSTLHSTCLQGSFTLHIVPPPLCPPPLLVEHLRNLPYRHR